MSDDYGADMTDAAVKATEVRVKAVYQQASDEMRESMAEWEKRHARRDAKYRQMVAAGKMSQADYDAWMRGQVFQGRQWAARQQQIDEILLNAEQEAARIVNEGKLGVFANNANYTGYTLEHDANIDTGFTLYDGPTVARLIASDPQILPKPAPGVQKDKSYAYYNRLMTSAITQGIVQGEGIQQIARRVARTTGESSYKSAMRNARTAYTGAQNAGRLEGMHQAQRLGIKLKKKWTAILDGRTRDAHRDLDGQVQNVDDPFESDLGDIMFPADPTAHPGNVYNCRCRMVTVYPDYPSEMVRRSADTGEIVGDMTYREWEAWKRGETLKPTASHKVVQGQDITATWHRRPDEFDFEINDVINAQGFDGLPRVVDGDEFDRAVQESGFIGQRSYTAPDQETLDAYREQLYNGEWYVDCGTGGAQYGQGLYCAADYNGQLTEGIQTEMDHYCQLGQSRCYSQARDSAYERAWQESLDNASEIERAYIRSEYFYDATREERRMLRKLDDDEFEALVAKYDPVAERARAARDAAHGLSYVETLTLDPSAKIITYRDLDNMRTYSGLETNLVRGMDLASNDRATLLKWIDDEGDVSDLPISLRGTGEMLEHRADELMGMDRGSLAAALGYDAINAEGHGQSGSYTVVLNRTKLIIRRP